MIINATTEESANSIIERAGIETIETLTKTFWHFKNDKIERPDISRWEEVVLEKWGIEIRYIDEQQLNLFI